LLVNSCCVCHYQIFVTVFVFAPQFSLDGRSTRSVGSSPLDVEDLLNLLQSAGGVAELHLVEGLGGVETVSVTSSHHVGVSVLLGVPAGTIPVLSVAGVATS